MINVQLFLGVDGGATKSIIRLEDEESYCLGEITSGPANIRISVEQAWQSIWSGIQQILKINNIDNQYEINVGIGIAGCEIKLAKQLFFQKANIFKSLIVESDAHIACLGAHGGKDGAVIIVGTGVVGYQIQEKQILKMSGWGFPHDDEGGGAWLGLEAMRATLKWLDGRGTASSLSTFIYNRFQQNYDDLIVWANSANATHFASLAPLVIESAKLGDEIAIALLKHAALHIEDLANAMLTTTALEANSSGLVLLGGLAKAIQPYLAKKLQQEIRTCQLTAQQGAILMTKKRLELEHHR